MNTNRNIATSFIIASHKLTSFKITFLLLNYILVQACAPSLVSMDRSELEQLKHQPLIHVVHYSSPSLIARTPSTDVGLAVGGILGAGVTIAMAQAEGEKLKKQCSLEDPSIRVRERVIESLSRETGVKNFRLVPERMESEELDALKSKIENALVMDFKTHHWTLAVKPWTRWTTSRYYVVYSIRARLIRQQDSKVMWVGYSHFDENESLSTSSTWDELTEKDCTLLKAKFGQAADTSAQQLADQFLGKTSPGT